MIKQIGWRLFQAAFVVLAVGILTFILVRSLPGDMAWRIAAGRYGYDMVNADAAAKVQMELAAQQQGISAFVHWIGDIIRFDFGNSLVSGEPVMQELSWQLGQTLWLALVAFFLTMVIALPIGIYAGCHPGGMVDRVQYWCASVLKSIPHFAIGLILIVIFAITLDWLPSAGHGTPVHYLLPSLTLAIALSSVGCRVIREATFQVTTSTWYRWGRQKGLKGTRLFFRHGLRNLGVPIVTWLGMQFVWLVEGVVVVETLFAWPGIGHALVHAIFGRDVPVIQATAMTLGLLFVVLNIVIDSLCYLMDPRGKKA